MKRSARDTSPPTRLWRQAGSVKGIKGLLALPFMFVDPLVVMQQWKRDIYYIQLQAPKPRKVECHIDIPSRPDFYGNEFHGEITRREADELLIQDGCYLVRESQKNPGCYTLAIRFDNATKNYKLYYDMNLSQHYVGDKYFDNLDDLVADGLICFHVHLKAPGYIASMNTGDDSHYEESPYMRYRKEITSRQEKPTTLEQSSPSVAMMRHNPLIAQAGILRHGSSRPHSNPDVTGRRPPPKPSCEPPARKSVLQGIDVSKFSSAKQAGDWMDIMQQEKPHNFKVTTFKSIANCWCEFCYHFMWGLIQQGVECQDCGFKAHKKCSEKLPNDCLPTMKKLKRMFGLDLTTLLRATNKSIPFLVEKCVEEIESRGIHHEGIYRIAGFHDDIEGIRKAFDLDGDADISEQNYEDIATITSVLKLFFRQLPVPLITFEVYPKLTAAVAKEGKSVRETISDLKSSLIQLPTSHYQTLKYLICHLNRVSLAKDRNMMSAENLSIVFAPTMLQSPLSDPIAAMTIGRTEARAIEALIIHYASVF
ncbi:N-chimaerin-like isoform X2 [Watersipora subatra]|uniref:N-chimaerin-like isoform X2 n=1 Tax=Watersipora subatra TaxID=2589382 RepID=UPI00355BA879